MTSRHRLLLVIVCLAPALGCVSFCGDDFSAPVLVRCDALDAEFEIDAIEVIGFQSFGGQGTEMVMFDVRYFGADPPTCAQIDYEVRDLDAPDFPVVGGGSERVETREVRPGVRETSSEIWDPWPGTTPVIAVRVSSHGRTGVDYVCRSGTLACARLDGGLDFDAGLGDAGPLDAGP